MNSNGAFLKQPWKMLVEITSQNSSVNSLCATDVPFAESGLLFYFQ